MAEAAGNTPKTTKRTTARKPVAAKKPVGTTTAAATPALTESNTAKAKSRFNAALEEAKAGAAALGDEAKERASA